MKINTVSCLDIQELQIVGTMLCSQADGTRLIASWLLSTDVGLCAPADILSERRLAICDDVVDQCSGHYHLLEELTGSLLHV